MLSRVQLFVTPWTAAYQPSLSITNSWSLLKLMSIESVMPSSHLILCRPLLLLPSIFPSIRVFSNESVLCISGESIEDSASALVLPMNIQDWFPLGLTGLISLQSKWLSRVFSNTTVQKHQFFNIQKMKIMASGPITSWEIDGEQWKQWLTLFFWAPKSLQMVIAAMKLKDAYSLEGKLWST